MTHTHAVVEVLHQYPASHLWAVCVHTCQFCVLWQHQQALSSDQLMPPIAGMAHHAHRMHAGLHAGRQDWDGRMMECFVHPTHAKVAAGRVQNTLSVSVPLLTSCWVLRWGCWPAAVVLLELFSCSGLWPLQLHGALACNPAGHCIRSPGVLQCCYAHHNLLLVVCWQTRAHPL